MKIKTEEEIKNIKKIELLNELKNLNNLIESKNKEKDEINKDFYNKINNLVVENLKKILPSGYYVEERIFDTFKIICDNKNYLEYKGKCNLKLENLNYFKNVFFTVDINNFLKNENYYKGIMVSSKISEMILLKKFDKLLIEINKLIEIKEDKISKLEIGKYFSYLQNLKERLEVIKYNDIFVEGNKFECNLSIPLTSKNVSYTRMHFSEDFVNADLIKIEKITPKMVTFKVRKKGESDWFTYYKNKSKKTFLKSGEIKKEKYSEKTDLIRKKKDFIYKLFRDGRIKPIKTDIRKTRIKDIMENIK